MRHLYRNIALVFALILLFITAITPPSDKLRLGKDLAGGTSLVYTVDIPEDANPDEVIGQLIAVLQKRVNPTGTLEISMVRQGRDRLEITMPLPTEEVKQLRTAYEDELAAFERAFVIEPAAFQRALRQEGAARRAAIDELAGGSEAKAAILEPIVGATELATETARAYNEARDAGFPDGNEFELLDAAGGAEADLALVRETLVGGFIAEGELERILAQPIRTIWKKGPDGEYLALPSERDFAIESIRTRLAGLPGAEAMVGNLVPEGEEGFIAGSVIDAYTAYEDDKESLDDPADLERLLRGSGVLEFRITADNSQDIGIEEERLRRELRAGGPDEVNSLRFRWVPLNRLDDWYDSVDDLEEIRRAPQAYFARRNFIVEPYGGQYYLLLHDSPGMRLTKAEADGEWGLSNAFPGTDQNGRPAIDFRMDARGSAELGKLTEPNVGRPMAVILDGRLYTAPTLQGRISNRGQITGNYNAADLNYIIQTLNAGSLSASLDDEPLARNTIAPELGLENLRRGLEASQLALIVVAVFMVVYYFSMGLVAVIALACNAIVILGMMALAGASFTLPGIAGVVLTFGMAVDANVLIYERIREELKLGEDLRSAVRIAYQKVFSTIVDANVTNLIVCFVLFFTATQEIKGFAVTLGMGVVGTMFSALVVARLVFSLLVDKIKLENMSQLPLKVKAVDKALEPSIPWVKLRPLFMVISAGLLSLGLGMIWHQGEKMLDTEFRGGVVADLIFEAERDDEGNVLRDETTGVILRETLAQEDVEQRVQELGQAALDRLEEASAAGAEADSRDVALSQLKTADVQLIITENTTADRTQSDHFKVKAVGELENARAVLDALTEEFVDVVDAQPALTFAGSSVEGWTDAPMYRVGAPVLGQNNIPGLSDAADDVSTYVGGVAIVMENISPAQTIDELEARMSFMRADARFASLALRRDVEVRVLAGSNAAVQDAVVLVRDRSISPLLDPQRWDNELAAVEWQVAREAFTVGTTLAGVQAFSPEIAQTFRAQAVVAVLLSFLLILIYIWVRFGSPRYSLAAILALLHDVIAVIGLIALAEIIYEVTDGASAEFGILPFRIDLGLVAALLTIIGYSLNDTIVILDRVRENRGKLSYASAKVVNDSINQTVSRTLITSGTTLIAVIVLFVRGGEGIASFTYALLCGVVVGTYSSIAIAAPVVYTSKIPAAAAAFQRKSTTKDAQDGEKALPEG